MLLSCQYSSDFGVLLDLGFKTTLTLILSVRYVIHLCSLGVSCSSRILLYYVGDNVNPDPYPAPHFVTRWVFVANLISNVRPSEFLQGIFVDGLTELGDQVAVWTAMFKASSTESLHLYIDYPASQF